MKLCFIADARSPTAKSWISYFVKAGDQVSIISSYPCASDEIPGATIFQVPLALASFSAGSHSGRVNGFASSKVAKVASEFRVGRLATVAQGLRAHWGPIDVHRKAPRVREIIEALQPDLVHAMRLPYEGFLAAEAVPKVPLLISVWGTDFTLFAARYSRINKLSRTALWRADALHCDCQRDMQLAIQHGFEQSKPWRVLPGGGGIPADLSAKLRRRFNAGLPSNRVKLMPGYLVRTQRRPDLWSTEVDRLGRHAATIAAKHDCGVLAYNHVATSAFTGRARAKVLFQVQPHPLSVRDALRNDESLPDFKHEPVFNELRWPREMLERYASEPLSADYCLTNCEHIKRTLIDHGVAANRIAVVPYGVDLEFFTPADRPHDGHFTVLFTGQLVRQKGLHLLLEAWRWLSFPDSELRIAGHGARNERLLAAYRSHFTFLGALDWAQLRDEYRRADLLCSPSLTEGFGLVNLEALACGTPVLTSDGCGAADIVNDGEDGFIVPAGELVQLMEKLEFAYRNRERLRAMRVQARAKAEQYPWSRFRATVARTLASLETRF